MATRFQVGDTVRLPSGRAVVLSLPAEPYRPWILQASGDQWQLKREHSPSLVHRSPWQHFQGDAECPLRLSERDARALATALNDVIPRRSGTARLFEGLGQTRPLQA